MINAYYTLIISSHQRWGDGRHGAQNTRAPPVDNLSERARLHEIRQANAPSRSATKAKDSRMDNFDPNTTARRRGAPDEDGGVYWQLGGCAM